MLKIIALFIVHITCIYFLRLLWKDKNKSIQRGTVMTKMGIVSKRKSPRWFYFSVWVDFIVLAVLYVVLIIYSVFLLVP